MKVTKIFGCVLSLHLCVIAVLLVQPGCQTGQPPTKINPQGYTQNRTIKSSVQGASRTSGDLIAATRTGSEGLDAAFNAGLEDASTDSIVFEPYVSSVTPIEPISSQQTVDIAGSGFQSYTIKKGDNLWTLSKRYGVSLDELYAVNGLNKNSVLRVGQQIQIPSEGSTATINTITPEVYQPSGYNQATSSYTVKGGDSLSKIAKQFDTSVGAIKAANGKSSDMIRVGETLIVPVGASATPAVTVSSAPTVTETASTYRGGPTGTHKVKSGEYPAKIAKQYGMTTSELLAMNSISDPRKLRVGQELIVSGSGSAVNVDSRIETVVAPAPAAIQIAPLPSPRSPAQVQTETISIIEADPLVDGEFNGGEVEVEDEDVFGDAVEIPVIRLQE